MKWIGVCLSLGTSGLLLATRQSFGATELAIWNVGQGQWATLIEKKSCYHFDIGGEYAPWSKIRASCRHKNNFALFSHWDWDHVGLVRRAARNLTGFCILSPPAGPSSPKARSLFDGIPICDSGPNLRLSGVFEISPAIEPVFDSVFEATNNRSLRSRDRAPKNAASRIFEVRSFLLLPGDSPTTQERLWLKRLRSPRSLRFLVLGHHGSRTSTSPELLAKMPGLKQAIASARRARYGHPHVSIAKRLNEKGIALLRTEEWGSIRIQFPASAFSESASPNRLVFTGVHKFGEPQISGAH